MISTSLKHTVQFAVSKYFYGTIVISFIDIFDFNLGINASINLVLVLK